MVNRSWSIWCFGCINNVTAVIDDLFICGRYNGIALHVVVGLFRFFYPAELYSIRQGICESETLLRLSGIVLDTAVVERWLRGRNEMPFP